MKRVGCLFRTGCWPIPKRCFFRTGCWPFRISVRILWNGHRTLQWSAGYTTFIVMAKKKLSLWPIWQTTQRQVVVAFLVDYIVLYLSIARSLETYYSVQRDLLQCQKRPTSVSMDLYLSIARSLSCPVIVLQKFCLRMSGVERKRILLM